MYCILLQLCGDERNCHSMVNVHHKGKHVIVRAESNTAMLIPAWIAVQWCSVKTTSSHDNSRTNKYWSASWNCYLDHESKVPLYAKLVILYTCYYIQSVVQAAKLTKRIIIIRKVTNNLLYCWIFYIADYRRCMLLLFYKLHEIPALVLVMVVFYDFTLQTDLANWL